MAAFALHASRRAGIVALCPLLLCWHSLAGRGAQTNPPPPSSTQVEQTSAPEVTAAYLQVQEQIQATQAAIERSLQESKAALAADAKAWSNGLQTLQDAFAAQRAMDLQVTQSSTRVILLMASALGAVGILSFIVVVYLQCRMSRGVADISASLPAVLKLVQGTQLGALDPREKATVPLLGAPEPPEPQRALEQPAASGSRPRRGFGRSIEHLLFPNPGDSLRRSQFRALKIALLFGLIFAAALALALYLIYKAPRP